MGQLIECRTVVIGEWAVLATDRSLTGQDGVGFDSLQEASATEGFAGLLAARLFSADPSVSRVFVASNQVMARRGGGWDESSLVNLTRLVRRLFVFYQGEG